MYKPLLALVISATAVSSFAEAVTEPSVAKLHAYKAYHHAEYMKEIVMEAEGTNILTHTTYLPTEGDFPVVTPALDHLYSKAVIDLSEGPVYLQVPAVESERYFSIHITDQEHYTIYDEVRPSGEYVFIREGYQGKLKEGVKVISSPGDYPHLLLRVQVKNSADKVNSMAIQEQIKLSGISKELNYDNAIEFTLETHTIYPENAGLLDSQRNYNSEDHNAMFAWVGSWFAKNATDNTGMFGAIDSQEEGANDAKVRAAGIIGHLGLPVDHAYYTGIFNQCDGTALNGSKPYTVTMPYEANVEEFWSITRYSALTRNTLPGKQDVYNAYNTQPNAQGNITITFSAEDPKDGSYWMPVNADEPYYYVERFYKPKGQVVTTQDFCKK